MMLIFFTVAASSQDENKMFVLFESGLNKVNSDFKIHFGGGVEYLLSKKSSLTLRLKYFKTGIDYNKEAIECSFASFFCSSGRTFLYEGENLKIPVNYKFRNWICNKKWYKKLSYIFDLI